MFDLNLLNLLIYVISRQILGLFGLILIGLILAFIASIYETFKDEERNNK